MRKNWPRVARGAAPPNNGLLRTEREMPPNGCSLINGSVLLPEPETSESKIHTAPQGGVATHDIPLFYTLGTE
jgi:hypothetical protein